MIKFINKNKINLALIAGLLLLIPLQSILSSNQISVSPVYLRVAVPSQDSASNTYVSDVIGNKTDTISGDSIVAIVKQVKANTDNITELETHFHSYEKWFEAAAVPSGEVDIADRVGSGNGKFRIDAGNDDWGSWVQILGSGDTPVTAGKSYYDLHMLQFENTERTNTYFIQIAFGTDGATALAAGTYSDILYTPQTNQIDSGPIRFQGEQQAVTTKAWARCKCPSQNTAWIDFYFGLHEYD